MSTPYDKLPENLRALFQPRQPHKFIWPQDKAPEDRRTAIITGVGSYLPALQQKAAIAKASERSELQPDDPNYETPPTESWLEKRDKRALEKKENQEYMATEGYKQLFKPSADSNMTSDPFRTLFIGRLSYDATKEDLQRAFERYGPLDRIKIVFRRGDLEKQMVSQGVEPNKISKKKRDGASQGYAFIMFRRDDDMKAAYKDADGISIRGRRVLVDVERGRTVANWKPKRFGGGLGGRHYTKAVPDRRGFGGFGAPSGPGFRGGFGGRGGFRGDGFRGRGGGYRGGGGRGGIGYQNGFPDNAPHGPRGGYQGGYGSRGGGGYGGGGGGYNDRGPPRGNANYEPLPPRGGGGGHRDRDGPGGGGGYGGYGGGGGFKRPYDDGPGPGRGYQDMDRPKQYKH